MDRIRNQQILRLKKLKKSLTGASVAYRGHREVYPSLVCARLFIIRALRAAEKSKAKKPTRGLLAYFFNPEARSKFLAPAKIDALTDEHRDEIRSIMTRLDELSAYVRNQGLSDYRESIEKARPEFEELTNLSLYLIDKYGLEVLDMPIALTDPITSLQILSIKLKNKLEEQKKYFNRLTNRFEKLQNTIIAEGLTIVENEITEPHPALEEMFAVMEALQSEFGLELPSGWFPVREQFTSKHRN